MLLHRIRIAMFFVAAAVAVGAAQINKSWPPGLQQVSGRLAADFAGGGAQEVLHASRLSRRARGERAADSGPGHDRLGRRRPHVGRRDARLHARHQREGRARAHRQDRRARRHESRRPDGQAHGVSGRPRPGALAQGARSRRARRGAAQPLAVPGHQRRSAGRSQRARHESVRTKGRRTSSTTRTACCGRSTTTSTHRKSTSTCA